MGRIKPTKEELEELYINQRKCSRECYKKGLIKNDL